MQHIIRPACPKEQHLVRHGPVRSWQDRQPGTVIVQTHVDAVLKRLAGMRKRLREDILFVGRHLAKMPDKLPHGRWGHFIEATFPLGIKTANTWIRAWEDRESQLALSDWDAYMRALYGNERQALRAPKSREKEDEQSGNPKFNEPLNPDRGKPAAAFHKRFAIQAEAEFFNSPEYTDEAKLDEARELKLYFEHKVKSLSERIARKEQKKD